MTTAESRTDRKDRRRTLWGSVIVVLLLAIAVLIISLENIAEAGNETVDYTTSLPGTGGLVAGAPVWIAGHEVGEVVSVGLLLDLGFLITHPLLILAVIVGVLLVKLLSFLCYSTPCPIY